MSSFAANSVRRLVIRPWLQRPLLKIAALIVLVAASATARSMPEMAPADTSLAGLLLVAAPDIGDPRFDRTVVLLLRHNGNGALGLVINRPAGEQSLADLMQMIGEDATGVAGRVPVFAGGPVEPGVGFVLHSADYHRDHTLDVTDHLAVTSTHQVLIDIAHQAGPAEAMIVFGYSGWGPGQLESELAQHGWFTAPADPKLVFDDDREKVWQDAMARRMRPL